MTMEDPTRVSEPAGAAGSTSSAGARSGSPDGAPMQASRRAVNAVRSLAIGGLLLAVLAIVAAVFLWQRTERAFREEARRWQEVEARAMQVEQQLKLSQEQVRELVGRSAVLENKLGEAIGQQAQLERMYKNIAQDSLDSVLADVESAISIASQQLLFGANVQGALVALQEAETSLKRADPASVGSLRRLISRDIDRLRATPITDVAALAGRIDGVAASVDQLPMLSSAAASEVPTEQPAAAAPAGAWSPISRIADSGIRGWQALKHEFQALIRVNRVDAPDAVLIAPTQQYFVRENLRLTLLSARLALLARNDVSLRADLERSTAWLGTYFDRNSKPVANAIATLKQLQSSRVAVEMPSLAESLGSVRALRSAREGAR